MSFLDATWEGPLAISAFGNTMTGSTATTSQSDVQTALPFSPTAPKGTPATTSPTASVKLFDDEAEAVYPYKQNLIDNAAAKPKRNKGRGKQKLRPQNQAAEIPKLNSLHGHGMSSTIFPRMEPESLPSLFPELQISDGPVPYEYDTPKLLYEPQTQDFLTENDNPLQQTFPKTLEEVDPSGDEVELENTESGMGFKQFGSPITLFFVVLGMLTL